MVVFTCSYCGESVHKPSIAKHYMSKCRGPPNLTCVDCLKDFRGNEYETHIKCLTEDERYAAKGYVPKASSNKGEKKQQSWFEAVQNILNTNTNLRSDERELLEVLSAHENLPRKRTKFMNFLQNAHRAYARRQELVDRVWNIIEAAGKSAINGNENGKNEAKPVEEAKETVAEEVNGSEKKKKKKEKLKLDDSSRNGEDDDEPKPKKQKKSEVTDNDGIEDKKSNIVKDMISSEGGTISLYKLNSKLETYCESETDAEKKGKLLKKLSKKIKFILNDNLIILDVDEINK